jgi:hypothetical protein
MSAADAVSRVHTAFAGTNAEEQRDWARNTLENAAALELIQGRITHASGIDVDLMARILTTRCYELREVYEEDRPQLWFLDWFRQAGLLYPLDRGVVAMVTRTRDYQNGEVRFIGDKTDDWPTEGGRMESAKLRSIKHFGKAVEYGILELWQAAREGRDIIGERVRDAFYDIDVFIDHMIASGAPMHGVYGFIGHPDIPVSVVPASVVNGPATTWPAKTPSEVLFDLSTARDASRVDANYNDMADTAIMADNRYSYINATEIGTNGDTILSRWMKNQESAINGGMKKILPFVPYNTAAAGGTPMMTVGRFVRENIEFPLLPAVQLPTEYHGAKWKIGFVGAASSVHIKRSGRFRSYTGI